MISLRTNDLLIGGQEGQNSEPYQYTYSGGDVQAGEVTGEEKKRGCQEKRKKNVLFFCDNFDPVTIIWTWSSNTSEYFEPSNHSDSQLAFFRLFSNSHDVWGQRY